MATRKQLSEKGYSPLWKGRSKTPLYMSEWNARKIAKDLHKDGFLAQAVRSDKIGMTGDHFWIVMMKKRGK